MALFDWFKQLLISQQKELLEAKQEESSKTLTDIGLEQNGTVGIKDRFVDLLTPREYDLYLQLLEGYSLKEAAKQLNIKYSIANNHMSSIYRKLNVKSRAKLIIDYRNVKQGMADVLSDNEPNIADQGSPEEHQAAQESIDG